VAVVHQVVGRAAPGDVTTEHALTLGRRLRSRGLDSELFAASVHPDLWSAVRPLAEYSRAGSPRGACVFHFAPGVAARAVGASGDRVAVADYPAAGPGELIAFGTRHAAERRRAERELEALAPRAALGLAADEAGRARLAGIGFARTALLPLLPERGSLGTGAPVLRRLLSDRRVNVLFAGELSPRERLEELLRLFAVFQRFVRPDSRLLVVGDRERYPRYYGALTRMADELRLEEVVFPGALSGEDLAACYRTAAAFVSCAPEPDGLRLVQAMDRGLPVLATAGGAAPVRLQDGWGLPEVAELLDQLARRGSFRETVLRAQRRALDAFYTRAPEEQLLLALAPLLGDEA